MIGLKLKIEDLGVKNRLKKIKQQLSGLHKPLGECGLVLLRSIAKNFKEGGRPKKWKPSHRAKATGGQTLVKTARLKNSVNMQVSGKTLTVGTNVKYARIHHLGGKIKENVTVKQHYRYMTKAFGRPIEGKRVMVKSHQRKMNTNIPARPFLVIQDEDWRVMERIVADHLEIQ